MFFCPESNKPTHVVGGTPLPNLGMVIVFNSCLVTITFGHPAASHQAGTKGGERTTKLTLHLLPSPRSIPG